MFRQREYITFAVLTLAIVLFIWISLGFDFVQDDAYITFRYVANYLNGDGLVYNIGERVEGYTNFAWLLLVLLAAQAGLDYVQFSQLAGLVLGSAAVLVTFLIARRCLNRAGSAWSFLPPFLLATCPPFAYWSQSGLETAGFVFVTALAVYLYLVRSWLLAAALVFAVLIRPEGALLAILLIVVELLTCRRRPWFSFTSAAVAFVFSLPFVGFKLLYYGSFLPNPFYAKTELGTEQLHSGLAYGVTFFEHYPILVIGFLVALGFWRKLDTSVRALCLFTVGFAIYVIVIGGDVLKVDRFFLPVIGLMAVALAAWLSFLTARLRALLRQAVAVACTLAAVVAGYYLPQEYVARSANLEIGLTDKMAFLAARLKETDQSDFSVAVGTIGRLGYDLIGHRVVDLLGLTDSTVARHPEPMPVGMESTWRERSFNSAYVLAQSPDYIVFSTGLKPSAPAERALLRYDQFLSCYRSVGWVYGAGQSLSEVHLEPAFKRTRDPQPPFEPIFSVEFVNWYNRGLNAFSARNYWEADRCFNEALSLGGEPPYVYILYYQAINAFYLRDAARGEDLQNRILEIDSSVAEIQGDLYVYEYTIGNHEKAAIHRRWFASLAPWLVTRYDSIAVERLRQRQMRSPQFR
jgi:arabinofuranosyltransferase